MRIAISGASGLVGRALRASLEADGHTVHALVRRESKAGEIRWSVTEQTLDAEALEGIDAFVHLAGENIGQRWSQATKERILRSRVDGTRLVAETLAKLDNPPAVLVSASAVGFYGDGGQTELDETGPAGHNFVAQVCQAWEAATKAASEAGIRVVHLRTGIALSTEGGALEGMLTPARFGAGGPLGSGTQWVPWIALDDLVAAYRFAIDHAELSGAVLGVAPGAVQQGTFAKTLGKVLGRPAFLPTPGFVLKMMMGQMAQELLLEGQRCRPAALQDAGFEWQFEELEPALRAELGR